MADFNISVQGSMNKGITHWDFSVKNDNDYEPSSQLFYFREVGYIISDALKKIDALSKYETL